MRGLRPRRAAMQALKATVRARLAEQPLLLRAPCSGSVRRSGDRSGTRYRRDIRSACGCAASSTAETSPQIWLRWMVATVSSLSCRARSWRRRSGEHMSGAQAETPTRDAAICARRATWRAAPRSGRCSARRARASTSNGPGSPMLPLALSQAFSHSSRRKPGVGDRLRVVLDIAAVFQDRGRAAADRLQRGKPHHRVHLVASTARAPAAAPARW